MANSRFEFSQAARFDLFEIADYISADSPAAAEKLIHDIENACERLTTMPTLGHRREDLTPNPEVLFYCVRHYYLVIYRKRTKPLQIVRILHSSRDVEEELREHFDD